MALPKPFALPLLALFALSSPAAAAGVTVEITGWCSVNCAAVGLAQEERFAGLVGLDNTTFEAGQWDTAAVSSFSFDFGTFRFSQADVSKSNNLIRWGATPEAVSEVYLFAFGSESSAAPGPFLSLSASTASLGTGYAAIDAFYATGSGGEFTGSIGHGANLNSNVLDYGSAPPAPVPLPAAGWLLVGSLLGFAALRQVRRPT